MIDALLVLLILLLLAALWRLLCEVEDGELF